MVAIIKLKLHLLMAQSRMTQKELIAQSGMSSATISNLYNEKIKRLDFDTLEKLCKIFNCKVEDLIEYIPDEN